MEEAADADYAVIIDSGKIAAEGTPLELKNRYTADSITLYGVGESDAADLGYPVTVLHGAVRISVPDTEAATKLIISRPELFRDYEIIKGRMDDVFLSVTGKKLKRRKRLMKELFALVKRNCKLFFRDKGMFFTSLITPVILLVLYSTFLAKVYRNSFVSALPERGSRFPTLL